MQNLIPVINNLQDVFNTIGVKGIDLPQIVVVGSQSAGKSSVLESIVGRDFLPRGSGMVTKRPLILQLVNLPPSETTEWGEFAHKPGIIFRDFEEIKKEIDNETVRLTGTKKTISPVAIRLKIYSAHVLDLTLVDLPGLTKISVGGQEKDISNQLRQMVLKFIEPQNAIILAVSAANVDLANSDALSVAREVDPDGERTIGVITKMDIMDKGTDAMDILYGRVYPLKLGYIGVLNRSQHDIETNVPIRKALQNEKKYFVEHSIYSAISDRLGIAYLTKTLNMILMQHIMKTLPSLRITITEMFNKTKHEYDKFADEFNQKDIVMLEKIIEYCTNFNKTISGELFDIERHELLGGAKLFDVFEKVYRPIITELDLIKEISDEDIKTAIKNAQGTQSSLFIPQGAFELLVRQQINRFSESSHRCVNDIQKEVSKIFSFVAAETVVRYSKLRDAIVEESDKVLQRNLQRTHETVQNLIDIEESYINTVHPDFDATEIIMKADTPDRNLNEVQKQPEVKPQPEVTTHRNISQQPQSQKQQSQKQQSQKSNGGLFGFFSKQEAQEKQASNPFSDFDTTQPQQAQPQQVQPQRIQPQQIRINPADTREQREIKMMRSLTKEYLEIIRKSVADFIPKSIMHFMVNQTSKDIQNDLIKVLYKQEKIEKLMSESQAVVTKREMLKKNYEALKKAYDLLEGIVTARID
ncbi:dynamin [Entamoeba marina]